ncbi:MAG: hypothetical protein ACRCWY_01570 [Cellulosilyticaceae bacterium]
MAILMLIQVGYQILKKMRCDMAKKGMRRPDVHEPHGTESNHKTHYSKDPQTEVQEIQGKAKTGNKKAGRIY